MNAAPASARIGRNYAAVTGAYWAFTLTDGALRTLVLLHLHSLGFTPLAIASMFLAYEALGLVTNLVGGWLGARLGLRILILAGLALQIVAVGGLALEAATLSVPVVLVVQGLSGVAKDLVKTGAKSYVKGVVPAGGGRLLKLVALLTGSKNALKGVGLLLGGVLLGAVGFERTCLGMVALLVPSLIATASVLPAGEATSRVSIGSIVSKDPRVNWLSLARLFLFGSRDAWFVLALPVFLREGLGWSFAAVSGFLAGWVIAYGLVQASAPRWVGAGSHPGAGRLVGWTFALLAPLALVFGGLLSGVPAGALLIFGLALFGLVFAANSAVHSYLIVEYAPRERASLSVGFYYSANAAGRLAGTILSGAVYQGAGGGRDGLAACIGAAMIMVAISGAVCLPLRSAETRVAAAD